MTGSESDSKDSPRRSLALVIGGSEYRFLFSVTRLQTQRTTLQQLNDV